MHHGLCSARDPTREAAVISDWADDPTISCLFTDEWVEGVAAGDPNNTSCQTGRPVEAQKAAGAEAAASDGNIQL